MKLRRTWLVRRRIASGTARGFTLVELLVVIALLAILSGGVMLSVHNSLGSEAIRDSVRRVGDVINFCHSTAVFEGQTFRLNFSSRERRCWVSYEAEPTAFPGEFEPYRASGFGEQKLQKGILFKNLIVRNDDFEIEEYGLEFEGDLDDPYFEFRPDGTTVDAIIVLASEKDMAFAPDADEPLPGAYSILLSGLTGQVQHFNRELMPEMLDRFAEEEEAEEAAGYEDTMDYGESGEAGNYSEGEN